MKSEVPQSFMQHIYLMVWRNGHHILYVFDTCVKFLLLLLNSQLGAYYDIKLLCCFQVYVANGKLQFAMPMDKVKEISKLSLMVSLVPCSKFL